MAKKGLSRAQVEHIARLASLPLTIRETPIFQEQLSEVVQYVQKISNIKYQISKTLGKEKTEIETRGRGDMVDAEKCLSQEDALSGTENKHNGLFLIPAIFEE